MVWQSFYGLIIGLITFLCIGVFHPLVVAAEYYCGVRSWWAFLALGILSLGASILMGYLGDSFLSIILGVIAFSSFWSIHEVIKQRERVLKGWFPKNPNRLPDYETSDEQ